MIAKGLRGSESLDVNKSLATLNQWAEECKKYTAHCRKGFEREPERYDRSEATFCMMALITYLQKARGIGYNLARVRDPDFSDSRDLFIHGLLDGRGGTCVSLPILYIAIGRRLGYPLHLAQCRQH